MIAAEQWIAKRRDHEGRGQRLHHSDYDRALGALEKVLQEHQPTTVESVGLSVEVCAECRQVVLEVLDGAFEGDYYGPVMYPCPTVRAIESALGIEAGGSDG